MSQRRTLLCVNVKDLWNTIVKLVQFIETRQELSEFYLQAKLSNKQTCNILGPIYFGKKDLERFMFKCYH